MTDQPISHTLLLEGLDASADRLTIAGDEARHAMRVKRVRRGERVLVLDGAGLELVTEVTDLGKALSLRVLERRRAEELTPRIQVWACAPKGSRASDMVDALSQVGAQSWTPLITERSGGAPTAAKLERLRRVAVESAKQCRRAWILRIESPAGLDEAREASSLMRTVLADSSGGRLGAPTTAVDTVRVLIGPEGGWTAGELRRSVDAGVEVCSFGPHVMRVETAAPIAVAATLHVHTAANRRAGER